MKKLRMIVPLNSESLLSEEHRRILGTLGHEPDWMLVWVLYQWPRLRDPHTPEVYDQLYTDIHELNHHYDEDEGVVRKLDHFLEENMEEIAEAAQSVYTRLEPFVGEIPKQLYNVECDRFGMQDMVLTFDLENMT